MEFSKAIIPIKRIRKQVHEERVSENTPPTSKNNKEMFIANMWIKQSKYNCSDNKKEELHTWDNQLMHVNKSSKVVK